MSKVFISVFIFFIFSFVCSNAGDSQTIKFRSLYAALGDADLSPAIASSGLTVTYASSDTTVATIVNDKIHFVGFGTTSITASQVGDGTYDAATDVVRVLTVGLGLPDMLAIELPTKGQTSILAEDLTMATLLASPRATGVTISHDSAGVTFQLGGTMVEWSATDDEGTTRTETGLVWVFPYGQTPIGVSGPVNDDGISDAADIENHYSRALGGNSGSNVARDSDGTIHVSWFDGEVGRPYRLWYRQGVQNKTTGVVTWTDAVDVADGLAGWKSFIAMTASENAIHFTWADNAEDIMYRRNKRTNGVWAFDAIQDTGLNGSSHDNGPDIAAFSDDEIHIVSGNKGNAGSSFDYGYRVAGSISWTKEAIAIPDTAIGYKYPAVTVDHRGEVHVSFTARFRSGVWGGDPYDGSEVANYYWKAWYMHRKRPPTPLLTFDEAWFESHDALNGQAQWLDPGATSTTPNDVVADWISIQNDPDGNIYMAWHGTALNLRVARDDAFITRRPFNLDGQDSGWDTPQALYIASNSPNNKGYSWAPSICADRNGLAFPVFFYKSLGVGTFANYSDMDSAYRIMLNGSFIDEGYKTLSDSAAKDMSTSFADTTPHLYRHDNGRAWLDVFQGMMPTNLDAVPPAGNDGSAIYSHEEVAGHLRLSYIVYQREEVTNYLAPYVTSNPTNITVESGQTATFNITAICPNTINYQWKKNNNPISGATTASYTTPTTTIADNGLIFSVTTTNASSSVNTTTANVTLTVQDTVAPSVPAGLSVAAITQTTFTLSWTASTDADGVTGYNVYKDGALVATTTATTYNIMGLTAETIYSFTVLAYDASSNNSAQSNSLAVTTLAVPDTTSPSKPSSLVATSITQASLNLSWTASTDNVSVSGYKVYQDGVEIGSSAANSFSVSNLVASTSYSFTVVAFDDAQNNSAISSPLIVSTLEASDATAPSTPAGLAASLLTSSSFTLTWGTSTDNIAVVGYNIFKDGILLGSSTTTNFEVKDLSSATTNSYTVSAYDASSNTSDTSAPLSITTKSLLDTTAPSTPTGFLASTVTQNGFTITWSASSDDTGVASYNVLLDGKLHDTTTGTTYTATDLSASKTFSVTIVSVDSSGNVSLPSKPLLITTLDQIDAPKEITISVITQTTVTLTWEESTSVDGVTSYTILQDGVEIATVKEINFEATGLEPATTYTYTIIANNDAGVSSPASEEIIITTKGGSNSNGESSGGGGCSYNAKLSTSAQSGNIFMLLIFPLALFFRRRFNKKNIRSFNIE